MAGEFGKQVGLAAVIGLLLWGVGVVLVGGIGLGAVQPERFGGIGAVRRIGEIGIAGAGTVFPTRFIPALPVPRSLELGCRHPTHVGVEWLHL